MAAFMDSLRAMVISTIAARATLIPFSVQPARVPMKESPSTLNSPASITELFIGHRPKP